MITQQLDRWKRQQKNGLFFCWWFVCVSLIGGGMACMDPQKQAKDLTIRLIYSKSHLPSGQTELAGVVISKISLLDGKLEGTTLVYGLNENVKCSDNHARGEATKYVLLAQKKDESGRLLLEGAVPFSKELCESGTVKIVMMVPERVGELVVENKTGASQIAVFGPASVEGVLGHASTVFGDGRVMVLGGISAFSGELKVPPSLLRPQERGEYGGAFAGKGWVYDPEAAILRPVSEAKEIEGAFGRAFHSIAAQGDKGWLVGGWSSMGWASVLSFALPPVSSATIHEHGEMPISGRLEQPSPQVAGHLIVEGSGTMVASKDLALIGGQRPEGSTTPPGNPPPACLAGEEQIFLTMHAVAVLQSSQEVVVSGGLWSRRDGSLLPPRFSNMIWRAPFAQMQGQPSFCATTPAAGDITIRAILKDGKHLSLVPGELPEQAGWAGHSMTAIGDKILVYGGFSLPPDGWPWPEGSAPLRGEFFRSNLFVRQRAYWLTVDGEKWVWSPITLQEGKPETGSNCLVGDLGARAMHQATRLLDGRILLSGGIRCLSSDTTTPPAPRCAMADMLHSRSVLLYTPRVFAEGAVLPSQLVYQCVGGGGTHKDESQDRPIPRLFHTATRLPSGQILLWGGLTSGGPATGLRLAGRVELFSPRLRFGALVDNVPSPETTDDGGPQESPEENIRPDGGPPEGTEPFSPETTEPSNPELRPETVGPDATPPPRTLMRHLAVSGKLQGLRTLIGNDQEINLFFALQGTITRLDGSVLESEDTGTAWSLMRMRFYANFAKNQWVEYDHARVIPRIKDSAQWDIVLDPQDPHRAVLAIRCSDIANKDIPISPRNPTPLSLCKVRGTETDGLAVLRLGSVKDIDEKYYAYAPLSSFLVEGNLDLHRLRVRGTGHADLVLIGKGGGPIFLDVLGSIQSRSLPTDSPYALVFKFGSAPPMQLESFSLVSFRSLVMGGFGKVVDYVWLKDSTDTRCLLASVKGAGVFEAIRSDVSTPTNPFSVGSFEGISQEGVFLACYNGAFDATRTWKMALHDAVSVKRPKQLLASQKVGQARLYVSFDEELNSAIKPHVLVLSDKAQILDTWQLKDGKQTEMTLLSDPNGGGEVPLYMAQTSSGLPWYEMFSSPSWFIYAPELSATPQGYAFTMKSPSPIAPDYWRDSFVSRASLASHGGMLAVAGLLSTSETFEVNAHDLRPVPVSGFGIFLWAREMLSDAPSPQCEPTQLGPIAVCRCEQVCRGCCGPLGLCRQTGESAKLDPLPFYCGNPKQTCAICDKQTADGCNASGACSCGGRLACSSQQRCEGAPGSKACRECKPRSVTISVNGSAYATGSVWSVRSGEDVTVSASGYLHRVPETTAATHQSLVVGIWREGYGVEAWGCAYHKEIKTMDCSASAPAPFPGPLDRGTRSPNPPKAPLWLSSGGAQYTMLAIPMVGNFPSCQDAMNAFEAMPPTELVQKAKIGYLNVESSVCAGTFIALETVSLADANQTVFPGLVARAKLGGALHANFTARLASSSDSWFSFVLVDGLGNFVPNVACFGPFSPVNYCPPNNPKQTGLISYALPAGLGAGRYFFRVAYYESATSCNTTPSSKLFPRWATLGEVILEP